MQTKQFRIGELAKKLDLQPFVIRFWEKEFNISPVRSEGQQRFYTKKELALFMRIKKLLYNEGLTIAGAKKQLTLNKSTSAPYINVEVKKESQKQLPDIMVQQLMGIREQLVKLKENLK